MNLEVLESWLSIPIIQYLLVEMVVIGIIVSIKEIIGYRKWKTKKGYN